ncbi:MAG: hypothetical protein QM831_31600 [Kofleriaceae bacterium]
MSTEPLDPQQVDAIGRVQHGFLFQHVVAARFVAEQVRTRALFEGMVVERDEDIEIVRATGRLYVQAKAYEKLIFSELKSTLLRMHDLRLLHEAGKRSGSCKLFFAIGGGIGEELLQRGKESKSDLEAKVRKVAADRNAEEIEKARSEDRDASLIDADALVQTWNCIEWLTPGSRHKEFGNVCFRASAGELLTDLTNELSHIPRLANSPSSAAYALTTSMHALAADSLVGFAGRQLLSNDVDRLVTTVEQRVAELPEIPTPFVPPSAEAVHFVRGQATVLLGSPGCGKSTQLAYEAIRERLRVFYLLPTESGAAGIRECAFQLRQQLIDAGVEASQLVPPNADITLAERVRSLCDHLPSETFIFIDDAHLLSDNTASRILVRRAAKGENGIVLCGLPQQEGGTSTEATLTTLIGKSPDVRDVPGWSWREISEVLFLRGTPKGPFIAREIHEVTGGYPAAVQALIDLATRSFDGDIHRAILSVRSVIGEESISAVVSAHFAALPISAREVAAAVALTKLPPELVVEELLSPEEAASGFRALKAHRCLIRSPNGFRLHDIYLHEANLTAADTIPQPERFELHERAAALLDREIQDSDRVDAVPRWLLNLGLAGHIEQVVDLITSEGNFWIETLQRIGIGTPLAHTIQALIPHANALERFWLHDCLVFLNFEENLQLPQAPLWSAYAAAYNTLEDQLSQNYDIDPDAHGELMACKASHLSKTMRAAKQVRDVGALEDLWIEGQHLPLSLTEKTILSYEYASLLYQLGEQEDALYRAISVMNFQMMDLRLGDREFWRSTPEELVPKLLSGPRAVVSRLADTLLLLGMCLRELGEWPAEIFARSRVVYEIIGAGITALKPELHMARQMGRVPQYRPVAIELMEKRLVSHKHLDFTGALVLTTTTLVALHESDGNQTRAEALLDELAHFDPEEIADELKEAREQLTAFTGERPGPLTSMLMRVS